MFLASVAIYTYKLIHKYIHIVENKIIILKKCSSWAVVMHAFNPSAQETETNGSL